MVTTMDASADNSDIEVKDNLLEDFLPLQRSVLTGAKWSGILVLLVFALALLP